MRPILAIAALALTASAHAQTPPPYTMPNPPAFARAGTVGAIADNSNQLNVVGPAVTFGRTAGSSYAGIATTVVDTTLPYPGSRTTPIYGSPRPRMGSSAYLRNGAASVTTNVSMQWRTAIQDELYGTSTAAEFGGTGPMPDSAGWATLASDVLQISGMGPTGPVDSQGRQPTDPYALEMSFDPNILVAAYQNNDTLGWTINDIIASNELHICWFNPISMVWEKQVNVITPGPMVFQNYQGSYAQFATTHGLNDFNLSLFVGSWGVDLDNTDPTNSRTWLITDHTSFYAVAPAPGAAALMGLAGLFAARRRRC